MANSARRNVPRKRAERHRRENMRAYLHFARKHGYPDRDYRLWAVGGVSKCMEQYEFNETLSRHQDTVQDVWSS